MNYIHNMYDISDTHCIFLVCWGMWRNGSG